MPAEKRRSFRTGTYAPRDQDRENPLKWLRDAVVDHQKNPIDNKCRIGIVAHSKEEAKWVNIEPDIDTESKFNLEQFKQTYFAKIEFISNFK